MKTEVVLEILKVSFVTATFADSHTLSHRYTTPHTTGLLQPTPRRRRIPRPSLSTGIPVPRLVHGQYGRSLQRTMAAHRIGASGQHP